MSLRVCPLGLIQLARHPARLSNVDVLVSLRYRASVLLLCVAHPDSGVLELGGPFAFLSSNTYALDVPGVGALK